MRPSHLIAVNSAACYVLAFLITTVLHECGHAFVGSWLGSAPVLHHNYVAHFQRETLPVSHQVLIAMAGPLVSLVQGSIMAWFLHRRYGGGIGSLSGLWLMLLGFGNFLGYLLTGPFFSGGDLGKAEVLLELPMSVRVIIALVGGALLTLVAYGSTRKFLSFAAEQSTLGSPSTRLHFNRSIIILPWLLGSLVVTLLYLPIVAIISIIYPIMSGMVFIFPWKNAKRITNAIALGSSSLQRPAPWLYAALIGMAVIFRLVLAPGIVL
ncbi:MAG: hypothetical protein JNM62_05905 [Flavobacteriales bacterium]|nr:hypothetical protein [Flavobacteriales bacterium]